MEGRATTIHVGFPPLRRAEKTVLSLRQPTPPFLDERRTIWNSPPSGPVHLPREQEERGREWRRRRRRKNLKNKKRTTTATRSTVEFVAFDRDNFFPTFYFYCKTRSGGGQPPSTEDKGRGGSIGVGTRSKNIRHPLGGLSSRTASTLSWSPVQASELPSPTAEKTQRGFPLSKRRKPSGEKSSTTRTMPQESGKRGSAICIWTAG